MPASEKTWRDQKALHVVFGSTGLLLLIATVWMFGADHSREWKSYQRKMREVDVRLTSWRMQAERSQDTADRQAELMSQLETELASPPNEAAFRQFVNAVEANEPEQAEALRAQYASIAEADDPQERIQRRKALDRQLSEIADRAKFEENELLRKRKFTTADFDEKRATYDLAVRDGLAPEVLEALQAEVDQQRKERDQLTAAYQVAADYREQLDAALSAMTEPVETIQSEIEDTEAEYERLASTLNERKANWFTSSPPFLGKKWLELPILDAFNSPLKIDNLWTKNLTIPNGSFGEVTRFDRCTTCHQSIDRTFPGSAVRPLYEQEHVVEYLLPTPAARPKADEQGAEPTLLSVYGIDVANRGLIDNADVAVQQVRPNSLAAQAQRADGNAQAGLQVGDVLAFVREAKVLTADQARRYLLEEAPFGDPVRVTVVRGLPHPFSSHPRLDLFVGSLSPHKLAVFGCSICHEGQGSATEFKFASHTPNTPVQKDRWIKEYGWFNNHHWIYPMHPKRFAQSSCLKCHHDVVELEIASNFDEPPAPKLMRGYNLIRQYGCFGCHEINGYSGPDKTVGPDMRLEPNFYAAAAQLKHDPGFTQLDDDTRDWVEQLVHHPERTEVRHRLLEFLRADAEAEEPVLRADSHDLIDALADVETPGQLRKVGPSLRHIAEKVGPTWLFDWLQDPTHFRPSTRMPRFFGLYDHLDEGERATAERYEPIEILGLVTYLLNQSQPLELPEADDSLFTGSEDQIQRGKLAFETRGCLACHRHDDFPVGQATQGPDLTNMGDKFALPDSPNSRRWLYAWLKNPSTYHPRTKMPDLFLNPEETEEGTVDPAADIAAYLLSSTEGWQPSVEARQALDPDAEALDDLVAEHLNNKLYGKDVEQALESNQIPVRVASALDGAERILADGEMTDEKKLMYIGQKTISKYGCYGCHDIPGFEKAKPIGTGLADWGRKDPSKLAFEHIAEYLTHGHGHRNGNGEHDETADPEAQAVAALIDSDEAMPTAEAETSIDETFYINRILENDRTGFIWQKLKEPRSYDFAKARNKDSFNDRLRMPLFPFNDQEREAVITFVLGLVAEPPAHEFVYHPDPTQQTMIQGHKALVKFNCIGCHIVEPETWTVEVPAGTFAEQISNPTQTYPFMPHQFTSEEVEASTEVDPYRGTITAKLHGMPDIRSDTATQRILDDAGDPWEEGSIYKPYLYPFQLWKPALIDGYTYQVGLTPIELEKPWIVDKQPTFGGDLTKWLLPRVTELEKQVNPAADGKQAYGWLPPPLIGQGNKVQTEWLHSFLLEPFPIRPAVFMRMPKFNMSSDEASALVNYFAAKDDAEYPYSFTPANQTTRLDQAEQAYQAALDDADVQPPGDSRLDHAMNIVTSSDYCVQCHIVGDFVPETSARAMAPDLSVVYRRMRPRYLRRWLANPKQMLPYTPMPVNVQYDATADHLGGVAQDLYHGTSVQQLDGLVDLLMNYPRYAKSRAKIAELVKPSAEDAETDAP